MTVTTFTSPKSTCLSANAGGGAIYVYPDAGGFTKDKISYFLSADAALSGTLGSEFKGQFRPHTYYAWVSGDGGTLYGQTANFILPEFPGSILQDFHVNYGRPCLKLDASGGGNINITCESGA